MSLSYHLSIWCQNIESEEPDKPADIEMDQLLASEPLKNGNLGKGGKSLGVSLNSFCWRQVKLSICLCIYVSICLCLSIWCQNIESEEPDKPADIEMDQLLASEPLKNGNLGEGGKSLGVSLNSFCWR